MLVHQAGGGNELSGRAIAALECIMSDERLLQRMQRAVLGQPFHGGDGTPLGHQRERQAAVDAPAVDQDRARAALAVVAAFLVPG